MDTRTDRPRTGDPRTDAARVNTRAVLEHFRALERADLDGAMALFAPDLVNHRVEPGSRPGRDGLAQTLAVVLACFPVATWRVEGIVADADTVAAKLVVEGDAQGVIMGVAAAGRRVSWRHIHWFRMAAGRCVEHDAVRDDRGLLRQLGMNVRGPRLGGLGGGVPPAAGR